MGALGSVSAQPIMVDGGSCLLANADLSNLNLSLIGHVVFVVVFVLVVAEDAIVVVLFVACNKDDCVCVGTSISVLLNERVVSKAPEITPRVASPFVSIELITCGT